MTKHNTLFPHPDNPNLKNDGHNQSKKYAKEGNKIKSLQSNS